MRDSKKSSFPSELNAVLLRINTVATRSTMTFQKNRIEDKNWIMFTPLESQDFWLYVITLEPLVPIVKHRAFNNCRGYARQSVDLPALSIPSHTHPVSFAALCIFRKHSARALVEVTG